VAAVPVIDRCLQPVALGEQRGVARRHFGERLLEGRPEGSGLETRARQGLLLHEGGQLRRDFKPAETRHHPHPCLNKRRHAAPQRSFRPETGSSESAVGPG
jgi:hypothetical protein